MIKTEQNSNYSNGKYISIQKLNSDIKIYGVKLKRSYLTEEILHDGFYVISSRVRVDFDVVCEDDEHFYENSTRNRHRKHTKTEHEPAPVHHKTYRYTWTLNTFDKLQFYLFHAIIIMLNRNLI